MIEVVCEFDVVVLRLTLLWSRICLRFGGCLYQMVGRFFISFPVHGCLQTFYVDFN